MANIKWFSNRFIDRLRPGAEIPDGAYTEEHLQEMLRLRMVRREVIDDPKPAAKPAAKKKASASK